MFSPSPSARPVRSASGQSTVSSTTTFPTDAGTIASDEPDTILNDSQDNLSAWALLLNWLRLSWAVNKSPNAVFTALRDLLRLLTLGFLFLFVVTAVLLFLVPDWHIVLGDEETENQLFESGSGDGSSSVSDGDQSDGDQPTSVGRNVIFKYAAAVAVCSSFVGLIVSIINLGALAAVKQRRVRPYLKSVTCFIVPVPLLFVSSVIATICAIGFHPVMSSEGVNYFAYVTIGILSALFLASILFPLCIGRANYGDHEEDDFSPITSSYDIRRSSSCDVRRPPSSGSKKCILKRQSWAEEDLRTSFDELAGRDSRIVMGMDGFRQSLWDVMQDVEGYRISDNDNVEDHKQKRNHSADSEEARFEDGRLPDGENNPEAATKEIVDKFHRPAAIDTENLCPEQLPSDNSGANVNQTDNQKDKDQKDQADVVQDNVGSKAESPAAERRGSAKSVRISLNSLDEVQVEKFNAGKAQNTDNNTDTKNVPERPSGGILKVAQTSQTPESIARQHMELKAKQDELDRVEAQVRSLVQQQLVLEAAMLQQSGSPQASISPKSPAAAGSKGQPRSPKRKTSRKKTKNLDLIPLMASRCVSPTADWAGAQIANEKQETEKKIEAQMLQRKQSLHDIEADAKNQSRRSSTASRRFTAETFADDLKELQKMHENDAQSSGEGVGEVKSVGSPTSQSSNQLSIIAESTQQSQMSTPTAAAAPNIVVRQDSSLLQKRESGGRDSRASHMSVSGAQQMLDPDVPMLNANCVNWTECKVVRDDSSSEEEEDDFFDDGEDEFGDVDGEEIWSGIAPEEVEIPTWLLDRLQANGWQAPTTADLNNPMTLAAASGEDTDNPDRQRSSMAAGMGGNDQQRPTFGRQRSQSFANGARRGSQMFAASSGPQFWKIPMPSRRATIADSRRQSEFQPQGMLTRDSMLNPADVEPEPRRKQSVIQIMQEQDRANQYALPGRENSVVDVRKTSVVMSGAVIKEILGDAIDEARLANADPKSVEQMEISLPNFRPKQKFVPKYCKCPKDPITGLVTHTCMTPATTMVNNSNFLVSYVCSEWGTRNQSTWASRMASRRGSGGDEDDTIQESPSRLQPVKVLAGKPSTSKTAPKKRIRNASLLAQSVGGIGGSARQDPEEGIPGVDIERGELSVIGEERDTMERLSKEMGCSIEEAIRWSRNQMSFTLDNDQIEFEVQTPLTPGTAAAEAQDEALPADYEPPSLQVVASATDQPSAKDQHFADLRPKSYSMGQRPSKQPPPLEHTEQADQSPPAEPAPFNSNSLSPRFGPDGKVRASGEVLVARSPRSGMIWDPAKDELSVSVMTMDKEAAVEDNLSKRLDSVENFELANMLFQQPDTRSDVLIVDVRGRDFAGGHIPSSINMRTSEVLKQPGHLIASARAQEVHQIIFTCMYSVLRARKCVTALQQYQTMEQKSNHAPYRIRISILTGGFHGWMNAFGHIPEGTKTVELRDPKYVDDFDPRSWSNCGPNAGGLVHVMDALWTEGGQQALSDALFAELGKLSEAQERSSADSVEDENKQTQRLIADVDDASQLPGVVNMDVSEPKNDANDESDGKDSSIPISSNNNMFGGLGDLAAMIPGGGKSKRAMTPEP